MFLAGPKKLDQTLFHFVADLLKFLDFNFNSDLNWQMSHKTWSNLVSLNFLMIFQNCWKLKFEFLVNFSLIENVADHSDNLNTLNLKRDFNVVFAIFEGFVTEIVVSLKNYQLILRIFSQFFWGPLSYISSENIFEWFGMPWNQHSKSNWFETCWKPFFLCEYGFFKLKVVIDCRRNAELKKNPSLARFWLNSEIGIHQMFSTAASESANVNTCAPASFILNQDKYCCHVTSSFQTHDK